jgi:hypothetical protein
MTLAGEVVHEHDGHHTQRLKFIGAAVNCGAAAPASCVEQIVCRIVVLSPRARVERDGSICKKYRPPAVNATHPGSVNQPSGRIPKMKKLLLSCVCVLLIAVVAGLISGCG